MFIYKFNWFIFMSLLFISFFIQFISDIVWFEICFIISYLRSCNYFNCCCGECVSSNSLLNLFHSPLILWMIFQQSSFFYSLFWECIFEHVWNNNLTSHYLLDSQIIILWNCLILNWAWNSNILKFFCFVKISFLFIFNDYVVSIIFLHCEHCFLLFLFIIRFVLFIDFVSVIFEIVFFLDVFFLILVMKCHFCFDNKKENKKT